VSEEPADVLGAEVLRWIRDLLGADITPPRLHLAGGSRQTYFFETVGLPDSPGSLVLRRDSGHGPFTGSPFSLGREAAVYRALADTAVPVPRILGISGDGRAVVMQRVPGAADLARLSANAQRAVFADFVEAIASLHQLDTNSLTLPGFGRPRSPQDHALLDLRDWSALARKPAARNEPLLTLALAWLARNAPSHAERTCLVQGDCGPGNFLVYGGRLSAIIDWELAHLGDPHDDLAWIEARTDEQRVYGFSDASVLHTTYENATGTLIDPQKLAYYRVFVALRCAIMPALIAWSGGPLGITGYVMALHRWLARLGRALAAATGVTLDRTAEPAGRTSEHELLYQTAIAGLRHDLLPNALSRQSRLNAKEALRLLRYLRARERHAAEFAAEEREDAVRYLGLDTVPDADRLRVLAARAGQSCDDGVLNFLTRRAERSDCLWREKS
jgi:aminoglycoside phosphotransferase (APT) family kinase protein